MLNKKIYSIAKFVAKSCACVFGGALLALGIFETDIMFFIGALGWGAVYSLLMLNERAVRMRDEAQEALTAIINWKGAENSK